MLSYFAYGSNLSVEQMERRCANARVVGVGCLRDHQLRFNRYSNGLGGGVADVVPAYGEHVWGVVYDITKEDLRVLNRYEGYPEHYGRFEGEVTTASGDTISAWVYTVVNKDEFIAPSKDYMHIIQRAAREFEFPGSYLAFLGGIETCNPE